MWKRQIVLIVAGLALVACRPNVVGRAPTLVPFPTMTPGYALVAPMPTPGFVLGADGGLINPASVAFNALRATPTPDYSACPVESETVAMADFAASPITEALSAFLSAGGPPEDIAAYLQEVWGVARESIRIDHNHDFTGEGTAEYVLTLVAPDGLGTLWVLGCRDGRYTLHYQAVSEQPNPPQLLWLGDMNNGGGAEIVFATSRCDSAETCQYQTQMLTWDALSGRFISILEGGILSDALPTLNDVDDDRVSEIIVRMESRGTAATGPLRTGLLIYDWNGSLYVLSIVQLDPPRYRIQVIHEADRAFNRLDFATAGDLYTLALEDEGLRNWFNDSAINETSYAFYRLLLVYAYLNDPRLIEIFQRFALAFPIDDAATPSDLPIYADMAYRFWNSIQATGNLHQACLEVLSVVEERPQALSLLNRYGSRSPTYTALDLCPF